MTQSILGSLGSDQVNSIGDTEESLTVAECLRQTYLNMLGKYEFPENVGPINLTPSGNPDQPTLMFLPQGTARVEWIKYFNSNPADGDTFFDQYGAYSQHDTNVDLEDNASPWATTSTSSVAIVSSGNVTFTVAANQTAIQVGDAVTAYNADNSMSGTVYSYSGTTLIITVTSSTGSGTFTSWAIINASSLPVGPGYQDIRILSMEDFFHMLDRLNPTENDVGMFTVEIPNQATGVNDSFVVNYKNDIQPQYCTIVRNYYLLFDSYDNTQDSTLQSNKVMCQAWVDPDFKMVDTFIPFMDDKHFPLLLNDAKSLAFFELKQMPHGKAEQETNKQLFSLMKWKAQHDSPGYFEELPDFGRRGAGRYMGWRR